MASLRPGAIAGSARPKAQAHAGGALIAGRYEVIEQLGRGGTAIVYRVRDAQRGGELALKQLALRKAGSARQLRSQFEHEFYVLAQLSHPSVIAVHEFGFDPAGPFYTMELLDGSDLGQHAPLEFRSACELAMQVCSCLSLLHSRGLLHRDITPRNLRRTRAGGAKVIDFGAMVRMGPSRHVVGTPPFVAPEVVHRRPLDARADLFSLGATLYFALTGHKPFTARTFAELNEAWRAQPPSPSALVPGIPPALDDLVASLLRIDPAGRPRSAFEVIQRLAAIAGTPSVRSDDLAHACLSTPLFVGRDGELQRFRQRLRAALAGDGGALLFEGEPGLGRTRLLDVCAIEAKLAGASALRVGARAAARAPLAGAQAIAVQLRAELPEDVRASVRIAVLDAELPALTTAIRSACEQRPLVLALDDLEWMDEASLAWLAALVHGAPDRSLLVVGALQAPGADTPANPALELIRRRALRIELSALSPVETETLLSSIFLGAPNVALLNQRLQRLTRGNVRDAMALVRHMVAGGLIRCSEGSWVLPAELALTDLPASSQDAARARLQLLDPPALRLAQLQALAFEGPWTRADYASLAPDAKPAEISAALARLVRHGVLVDHGGAFTLAQLGLRACLATSVSAEQAPACHLALAELCARSQRPVIVEVHHRLLAGQLAAAFERLIPLLASISSVAQLYAPSSLDRPVVARILEHAKGVALAIGRPAREVHVLEQRLLELSLTTDAALYHRHAPSFLARIERDSGLCDYRSLDPQRPRDERLREALRRARARHDATPEHERVFTPEQALRMLGHFVTMSFVITSKTNDAQLSATLPAKLEPFAGTSPLTDAMYRYSAATVQVQGMVEPQLAHQRMSEVHALLERLDGKDYAYFSTLRSATAGQIAVLEVALGHRSAERWIEMLAGEPLMRLRALNLRRILCIFDGDAAGAERLRHEADLLGVQTEGRGLVPAPPYLELLAHIQAGDLTGVRQVADRLERLAARSPAWQPTHALAQAAFHRLRGALGRALAESERSLALSAPSADAPAQLTVLPLAAAEHVLVLIELGRAQDARAAGLAWLERCAQLGGGLGAPLQRALALAEAACGEPAAAAARLDRQIAQHEGRRASFLALDYDARARVAIAAHDRAAAARFAALAGCPEAAGGRARAQHERLLEAAKRAGIELTVPGSRAQSSLIASAAERVISQAVRDQLASLDQLACASERPSRVLELLLRSAGARAGVLYYRDGTGLTRVASARAEGDAVLDRFVAGYMQRELARAAMTTVLSDLDGPDGPELAAWTGQDGTVYRVALLSTGEACVGLVALCELGEREPSAEYRVLAGALAARLLASGDVQPVNADAREPT